jgi:hypothetical protein
MQGFNLYEEKSTLQFDRMILSYVNREPTLTVSTSIWTIFNLFVRNI